jgi:uncharacterized protein YfbU (UPF0304 family)
VSTLNFTSEQRLIVALLCDLYKQPKEREFSPDKLKLIMDAICGGHDWAIDWAMGAMFPARTDTPEDVLFVVEVLDMWRFIEHGWSKLGEAGRAKVKNAVPYISEPIFAGFDGNNEIDFLAIAQMMVGGLNRFDSFKGRSLNSPAPKEDLYRQMLVKWPAVRSTLHDSDMTADQIIDILSREQ